MYRNFKNVFLGLTFWDLCNLHKKRWSKAVGGCRWILWVIRREISYPQLEKVEKRAETDLFTKLSTLSTKTYYDCGTFGKNVKFESLFCNLCKNCSKLPKTEMSNLTFSFVKTLSKNKKMTENTGRNLKIVRTNVIMQSEEEKTSSKATRKNR